MSRCRSTTSTVSTSTHTERSLKRPRSACSSRSRSSNAATSTATTAPSDNPALGRGATTSVGPPTRSSRRVRILIVNTFYPAFVESHYRANPSLREEPYSVQWRSLMDTFFAQSDAYSHYLGKLGHETHELVVDVEPLQLAWAREQGVRAQ